MTGGLKLSIASKRRALRAVADGTEQAREVQTAADLVFKALADSGRRRILDRLRVRGGLTLIELCEGMVMSRQGVTKHVDLLEEAGLVVTRRLGREKLHYLNPVPIHEIAERWIRPFERGRLDALRDLKAQLER